MNNNVYTIKDLNGLEPRKQLVTELCQCVIEAKIEQLSQLSDNEDRYCDLFEKFLERFSVGVLGVVNHKKDTDFKHGLSYKRSVLSFGGKNFLSDKMLLSGIRITFCSGLYYWMEDVAKHRNYFSDIVQFFTQIAHYSINPYNESNIDVPINISVISQKTGELWEASITGFFYATDFYIKTFGDF